MKKVIFMGDSITANFKELNDYPNIENMGVGGYKSTELIPLVKELRVKQPDVVFLMVGINDFLCNKRLWINGYTIPFEKTYDVLLDLISTNLPRAKLYLLSILPMNQGHSDLLSLDNVLAFNKEIDQINLFIKAKMKAYEATYLDLNIVFKMNGLLNEAYTIDGIHLSPLGYKRYLDFLKTTDSKLFI